MQYDDLKTVQEYNKDSRQRYYRGHGGNDNICDGDSDGRIFGQDICDEL